MKRKHPAINKITPPDLPEVIQRQRLFDLLDHKQHYRLTWVSGMAGSGKTTLVASYLAERGLPCLWYQIDERDEDAPTFFHYLGLAARRALPRMRKPFPRLVHTDPGVMLRFSQGYFEALCHRLSSSFVMVFDNFQNVSQSSGFHTLFQKGISRVSADIHVLILSRTDPPAVFAGMLANNHLRVLGPDNLNLTLEETAAILRQASKKNLPPDTVRHLHQKTRGWAAGLILMAAQLRNKEISPAQLEKSVPAKVYDYFAGELFDAMDDDLKDFLLKTAFLPVMTASTAASLTKGAHAAGRMLSNIHRSNLFIERFSASAFTYQYNPLFRGFLLSRALDTFDSKQVERIRQNAASLMESSGRIEDAAELYAAIGDTVSLIRLIHSHAISMITQGRLETLHHWLTGIPEGTLSKDPWLLFWMGMSFRPASAEEARRCFEKSFRLFNESKSGAGLYLSWSKIIDSIVLAWDDFIRLDAWIGWLESHPLSDQPSLPVEIQAKAAACMAGALIIRRPHHPRLATWIHRALDLSMETRDLATQIKASIWAVTYYMWTGDVAHAELSREKARRFIQFNTPSPLTAQFWKWLDISADVRTMTSPRKVLRDILRILKDADARGEHLMDQLFFPPGMFAALVTGEFSKAEYLLARFSTTPDDAHRHGHAIFHHFKGLLHMIQAQIPQALVHAETALELVQRSGYVFYEALCRFQMAHLFQRLARYPEAEDHLGRALAVAGEVKSPVLVFMCLLEKARIHIKQGKKQTGLEALREAMALGRKINCRTLIWWWDPVMISELCAEALAAGIEVDYAQHMIQLHNLNAAPPANRVEAWPWPVQVYTFSRFQLLMNGKPLEFKGRPPRKPLELLQALIALGGVDVPLEKIIDALWFDADGDMAASAFSTALNRLRSLIGNNAAIQLKNGLVSLDMNHCWVDALAFQNDLAQANAHADHPNERSAALFEKALTCYKGQFLPGADTAVWAVSARERLKNSYLSGIRKLGGLMEQKGETEKAMEYYEAGLDVDPLVESLYQHLMRCQLHLGRHADAARTYQQCRTRLAAALNVAPSSETEAIYSQIRN